MRSTAAPSPETAAYHLAPEAAPPNSQQVVFCLLVSQVQEWCVSPSCRSHVASPFRIRAIDSPAVKVDLCARAAHKHRKSIFSHEKPAKAPLQRGKAQTLTTHMNRSIFPQRSPTARSASPATHVCWDMDQLNAAVGTKFLISPGTPKIWRTQSLNCFNHLRGGGRRRSLSSTTPKPDALPRQRKSDPPRTHISLGRMWRQ